MSAFTWVLPISPPALPGGGAYSALSKYLIQGLLRVGRAQGLGMQREQGTPTSLLSGAYVLVGQASPGTGGLSGSLVFST